MNPYAITTTTTTTTTTCFYNPCPSLHLISCDLILKIRALASLARTDNNHTRHRNSGRSCHHHAPSPPSPSARMLPPCAPPFGTHLSDTLNSLTRWFIAISVAYITAMSRLHSGQP